MHNLMAAQSAGDSDTIDPIEQAARASGTAAGEFAGCAARTKEIAATAGDQAMRAGVELMQGNAETVQHAFQCGARLAARLTELSAGQFSRAFGISGASVDDAAEKSAHNVEAIVQSGAILTEITRRLCEEWTDVARARAERGFERLGAFMQCRTPQDFTALQSELLRDNMETFLAYARKAAEHSMRITGETKPPFGNSGGRGGMP
jgi:hypothetical protein